MEYDDIVGCCMLGLVKAAGMYDPGRGKVFHILSQGNAV